MALMKDLIYYEPYSFEEVISQQVWVDAMLEEYNSIMKKFFWEVDPKLRKGQLLVPASCIR